MFINEPLDVCGGTINTLGNSLSECMSNAIIIHKDFSIKKLVLEDNFFLKEEAIKIIINRWSSYAVNGC